MARSLLSLGIAAALPSLLGAQTYRSVDAAPLLRIQGVTPAGELTFAGVAAATRSSDGTTVVADRITSSIHFFDRDGTHLGRFGREGDGPGEFRHIAWIGTCGSDRVHVWAMVGSRLTVVDKDRVVSSSPGDSRTSLVAFSQDGRFLGRLNLPADVTVDEVGADYVLGSIEDALGEQSIVLYRLHDR